MPSLAPHISVMLAVTDARAAVDWYKHALGIGRAISTIPLGISGWSAIRHR